MFYLTRSTAKKCELGIHGQGGRSDDGGRVGLDGLPLCLLVLLPQEAISGLVNGPCHMVLKFSNFLAFLALPRLGWFLLPRLIFLLFPFVGHVLLVPFCRALLVVALVSLASDGAELGIKLELTLQRLDLCGHCHNFLVVGRFVTPFPFCLEEVELAFCHGHHGLVSETRDIPVKVLVLLGANVLGEVVARDQEVGFEEDADGVVEGGSSRK